MSVLVDGSRLCLALDVCGSLLREILIVFAQISVASSFTLLPYHAETHPFKNRRINQLAASPSLSLAVLRREKGGTAALAGKELSLRSGAASGALRGKPGAEPCGRARGLSWPAGAARGGAGIRCLLGKRTRERCLQLRLHPISAGETVGDLQGKRELSSCAGRL